MIKDFLQQHRALLLTVVITSAVTTTVASGYFVIKNEKEKTKQQVEALQKSVEELQAKNETNQEANKEAEKDIPVSEATTQQTQTAIKSVEVAPIKVEEKIVSCLAFDGTTLKVSESECDLIKQKNVIAEKAIDKYNDCLSKSKERFQEQLANDYKPAYTEEYNSNITECVNERNNQLKKLK
ncbi:MAG: hypothetical protein WAV46_01755 [Candidatus Moraniibacteriota bacterium]